jgi:2-oxoglutarate dehydrogenase E2 component (dihydrolipoamide succinyltransferase)
MAIDVVMPQMGESIAEGTVVRWIKKPGDKVERDEPLLEISTDKVDAEIPSPPPTLSEVSSEGRADRAVNGGRAESPAKASQRTAPGGGAGSEACPAPSAKAAAPSKPAAPPAAAPAPPPPASRQPATGHPRKGHLSRTPPNEVPPLVRKIAAENNVDIAQVQGSGISGRHQERHPRLHPTAWSTGFAGSRRGSSRNSSPASRSASSRFR